MRADAKRHRTELIEAAARVFAREGHDAPLQAVLEEASLGRGTLYRHFPDREALCIAVLEHELGEFAQFVAERTGDPGLFREFLRRQGMLGSLHSPIVKTLCRERFAELLVDLTRQVDALYAIVVQQAQRFGHVSPSFDIAALTLVTRMLVGAAGAGIYPAEQAVDVALDMILEGLRPRSDVA